MVLECLRCRQRGPVPGGLAMKVHSQLLQGVQGRRHFLRGPAQQTLQGRVKAPRYLPGARQRPGLTPQHQLAEEKPQGETKAAALLGQEAS